MGREGEFYHCLGCGVSLKPGTIALMLQTITKLKKKLQTFNHECYDYEQVGKQKRKRNFRVITLHFFVHMDNSRNTSWDFCSRIFRTIGAIMGIESEKYGLLFSCNCRSPGNCTRSPDCLGSCFYWDYLHFVTETCTKHSVFKIKTAFFFWTVALRTKSADLDSHTTSIQSNTDSQLRY